MKLSIRTETIPLVVLEIEKHETPLRSATAIAERLEREIQAHPYARYIGLFDHYAHTRALPEGEIAPGIRDARNVVFCFGMMIPDAAALATRPRSIGIAELDDRFVISFLEPPMPVANAVIERWVNGLVHAGEPLEGAGFEDQESQ